MTLACFPGSFDPVTLGHLDVVTRALRVFDRVVIAVLKNASKSPMFSVEERVLLLRSSVAGFGSAVEVQSFHGLAVTFCRERGIKTLIRGLRTPSDFEMETQMALANRRLDPEIDTLFVVPDERLLVISSRLIKEIALSGGPLSAFVPVPVEKALLEKHRLGST